MALGGALTDKGRVISPTAIKRVAGTTVTSPTATAWFKCRLTMPKGSESDDAATGRKRTPQNPTLLVGKRDKARETIHITTKDRIEILSKQLGEDPVTFEVIGDPEPIRKKANRFPFAWEVNLERLDEHLMPEAVA